MVKSQFSALCLAKPNTVLILLVEALVYVWDFIFPTPLLPFPFLPAGSAPFLSPHHSAVPSWCAGARVKGRMGSSGKWTHLCALPFGPLQHQVSLFSWYVAKPAHLRPVNCAVL